MTRFLSGLLAFVLVLPLSAVAWGAERFPPPDFESGHKIPAMTRPLPRPDWQEVGDVAVLLIALSLAAWFVFVTRRRRAIAVLSVFSLAYFGFYREGCICPIGAIQNVTLALADAAYFLPLTVTLFFALPLLFSLLFGRVFCGGVCPLGAIQDVVLVKPLRLPEWIETALGVLPFIYLGAAVLFAALDTMFIICRYDPFVSFFRMSGQFDMLLLGGAFLLASVFIGRPYCRFLCPYGALLGICSRWSWRRVSATPDDCVVCTLCEDACAFGAIQTPTPDGVSERGIGRIALLILVVLPVIGAVGGRLAAPSFARADKTVQLAARIWLEESKGLSERTLESEAFRKTGQPYSELFEKAQRVERRFSVGVALFGAWCGLVVALKLFSRARIHRREIYDIAHADCVACARCFISCPRERLRLKEMQRV